MNQEDPCKKGPVTFSNFIKAKHPMVEVTLENLANASETIVLRKCMVANNANVQIEMGGKKILVSPRVLLAAAKMFVEEPKNN